MTAYYDVIRSVTTRYNDKIKKSCAPLFDCYSLNHFWYCKIDNNGQYSFLGSDVAWCEYFASEKYYLTYPFLRHPTLLQPGINLLHDVNQPGLGTILSSCKDFNLRFCLSLINKVDDGIEEIGFASAFASGEYISMLVNEIPLLRLFAKRFREGNAFIFSKVRDNQLDMAKLIGPTFYERSLQILPSHDAKQALVKKMGLNSKKPLTQKESIITKLLLEGYSAGKIAPKIHLSPRTVEHYIDRIKGKLGCNSKTDLIIKARELELCGYLEI